MICGIGIWTRASVSLLPHGCIRHLVLIWGTNLNSGCREDQNASYRERGRDSSPSRRVPWATAERRVGGFDSVELV